jgi:hypothetical protein|tara:strand:+ start:2768 stop:3007 length:240 start_codon:yes stop_codon:yes gene_type:complete
VLCCERVNKYGAHKKYCAIYFVFAHFLWPAEGKKNRGDVAAEEGNPRKERDQRRKDDAKEKKKKTKKTNEFRDTTHTCH